MTDRIKALMNKPDYLDAENTPGRTGFYKHDVSMRGNICFVDFEAKEMYNMLPHTKDFAPHDLGAEELESYVAIEAEEVREHVERMRTRVEFLESRL